MKQFKPSATAVMSAKAHQMRKEGIRVFDFAAGDPVLANHPVISEAAQEALCSGMSPYAPVAGLPELRQAAFEWMNRRYQANYGLANTIVTCGGKFGIYAALQILLEPGDEVLIGAPHWVSYPEMVRLGGGVAKVMATACGHWKMTPELLKGHLTKKTKVLILNNACNPTGVLYSQQEIGDLLAVAAEADLFVISDEVYSSLVFDGARFASCALFPEYQSRVLIIESCSKSFGMTGWRVGFAFGAPEMIANMVSLQSQSTTGTSFIGQEAALGALFHADEVSRYVREAMDVRRRLFFTTYNQLFSTRHAPVASSLYFFTKIGADSMAICQRLLGQAHVTLVPGVAFGAEGYARFAFSGEEEDIVQGLNTLKKYWQPSD